MSANFTPSYEPYHGVRPFRAWCQKVLPLVYDDSLSYYELLSKVLNHLNLLVEDVDAVETNTTALASAFEALQNYVNTYFDSLDVQQAIDDTLDRMVSDGTFDAIIDRLIQADIDEMVPPLAASTTESWLRDNVTPVGSAVTVDASLSVGGSAADALQTGKIYKDLVKNVGGADLLNVIPNFTPASSTWNGITFTWNASSQTYTVTGTATANSFVNVYYQTNQLPLNLKVGDPVFFELNSTDANVTSEFYWYTNGALGYGFPHSRFFDIVPTGTTGLLIRLAVASGRTVNGTVSLSLTKTLNVDNNNRNYVFIPPNLHYAVASRINKAFDIAPVVILGRGQYLIDEPIEIPENGCLMGLGKATQLYCKDTTFNAVHISHKWCTVRDLRITGRLATLPNAPSDGSGIFVDGSGGDTMCHQILNCEIEHFTYAGIRLEANSYWCADSTTVNGCVIHHCYAGIYTKPLSEYNRVSDTMIYSCYIGVRNDGGNNVFVNCTLTENINGFYITDGADTNDGHGTIIGCTLNHSDSNNGYGILFNNVTNGYQVSDCHFWYSKVYCENAEGISFNGCVFGRASNPIEITNWSSAGTVFANCRFKTAPTITGSTPIFVNCYTFNGTSV